MTILSVLPREFILYYASVSIFVSLLLVMVFFGLCFRRFVARFRKIKRYTWVLLAAIILLAGIVRFYAVEQQHLRFIDEFWYMESAKNFLHRGKFELSELTFDRDSKGILFEESYFAYDKEVGWPLLISLAFVFFGVNTYVPIYLSLVLGVLTIPLIFFVGYLLFEKEEVGLFAALFLAMLPLHSIYSASGDTVVPGLFFSLLTLAVFLFYFGKPDVRLLLLAIFLFVFTIQLRLDSIFLVLPLFFLYLWQRKLSRSHYLWWLVAVPFLFSYFVQASSKAGQVVQHEQLSSTGIDIVLSNIREALHILSVSHSKLLLLFALIGLSFAILHKRKELGFLVIWLSAFILFYPIKGVQDRLILPVFPAMMIVASYGLWKLASWIPRRIRQVSYLVLALMLMVVFVSHFKSKTTVFYEDNVNRYALIETGLAEELVPTIGGHYMVTEWPTILRATTDLKVIRTREVLNNPGKFARLLSKEEIFFLEEMWCVYNDSGNSVRNCALFKNSYTLEPHTVYRIDNARVVIYLVRAVNQ